MYFSVSYMILCKTTNDESCRLQSVCSYIYIYICNYFLFLIINRFLPVQFQVVIKGLSGVMHDTANRSGVQQSRCRSRSPNHVVVVQLLLRMAARRVSNLIRNRVHLVWFSFGEFWCVKPLIDLLQLNNWHTCIYILFGVYVFVCWQYLS